MDIFDQQKRSQIMCSVRSKRTNIEETVAKLLNNNKIKYKRNVASLPGTPDFLIQNKIALFVNGCFWHGHYCSRGKLPKTDRTKWKKKIEGNKARDLRVQRKLRYSGFAVLNIWQCELKHKHYSRIVKKIQSKILKLNSHDTA